MLPTGMTPERAASGSAVTILSRAASFRLVPSVCRRGGTSKQGKTGASSSTDKAPWRKKRDADARRRPEQRWVQRGGGTAGVGQREGEGHGQEVTPDHNEVRVPEPPWVWRRPNYVGSF